MSRVTQLAIDTLDTDIKQLQQALDEHLVELGELRQHLLQPSPNVPLDIAQGFCRAKLLQIEKIDQQLKEVKTKREALTNAFQKRQQVLLGTQLSPPSKKRRMQGPLGPSSLKVSCSSATADDIRMKEVTGYVFHHEFTIALYNLRQRLITTENSSEFKFMDNTYQPNETYLNELMTQWKSKSGDERAMTPYLSCALDRFLFCGKDEASGYCLHQGAIYGMRGQPNFPDFPDFCVVPIGRDDDTASCVAISDFKKKEHSAAVTESSAYSLRCKENSDRCSDLRLVFPTTKDTAELIVHYPIENKVVAIRVYPGEEDHCGAPNEIFFRMLYAGVHHLLKKPIASNGLLKITRDLVVYPKLEVHEPTVKRIFRDGHHVYKLFGHNGYSKANIAVVNILFPSAEEVSLTEDRCYSYVKYEHISGVHQPFKDYKLEQFANLLEQLSLLHAKNYVHSDIREENLVFSEDSAEAFLIDFDLADTVGVYYPPEFCKLPFRHPEARANRPRAKEHDVFSLSEIAEVTGSVSGIFNKYIGGKSLVEIATELRAAQEQPTTDLEKLRM